MGTDRWAVRENHGAPSGHALPQNPMQVVFQKGKLTLNAGGFSLGPGQPALRINDQTRTLRCTGGDDGDTRSTLLWRGRGVELTQRIDRESRTRLRITSTLRNTSDQPFTLNDVGLFEGRRLGLGPQPADVRIFEQSAYFGRVRTPRQMFTSSDQLTSLDNVTGAFASDNQSVFYNPATREGLLIGFEIVDRWLPRIIGRMFADQGVAMTGMENVDAGPASASITVNDQPMSSVTIPRFRQFTIGFDGGDLVVAPGESIALGELVFESGTDPLALLDAHGKRIKKRNRFADPPGPMVNWCSWYPYRLSVDESNVLANARAARDRNLHALGLSIIQLDLGWQRDNIPTYFEENERFSRGLAWLSDQLRKDDFKLGVWVGVLCVADTHPVAHEHPEWLLRSTGDQPHKNYDWFWATFCPIYALDVSHPGAQNWLRENFTRLAEKGVRFVKWDFAGIVTETQLRQRHDPRMINARSREALQTAFRIAQDALDSQGEKSLMIDCSATDLAGAGIAALNYANLDTGNTGLGWRHLREVYTAYACHLFKHHWALLQPSCLVVGLPGTLEEARIRATVTFMGAGHVDIGDDLTTLPEDRWSVLLATLPPNDTPAKPVDLFEPIATGTLRYLDLIKEKPGAHLRIEPDPQGTSIWALPIKTDWDEWTLVAVFNWTEPPVEAGSHVNLGRRYQVSFERLGLPKRGKQWAYEFWSGQFLGEIPRARQPAGAYRHPGDFSHPILESDEGVLDIGFHGPAVKLLVLRQPRAHPWPLGTSFHQSGGRELTDVKWHAKTRTLSGQLHRPQGESGFIMIAIPGETTAHKHPLIATGDVTEWSVRL